MQSAALLKAVSEYGKYHLLQLPAAQCQTALISMGWETKMLLKDTYLKYQIHISAFFAAPDDQLVQYRSFPI